MNNQSSKTEPLVSFIIPYYNLPVELLQKCLDSIRGLSLRTAEREIILIDDGSERAPLPILNDHDLLYVRKPNGGVSTARNMGLRMATGQYIHFIDADDWLIRAPYEHVLDIIRYGEDIDMVMFDFSQKAEKTDDVYSDYGPVGGSQLLRERNIHGSVWGYAFRRKALGELTFSAGIDYGEDEEFTPQLLLRCDTVVTTTAKAYYYTPRKTSATHNTTTRKVLRRLDDNLTVIRRLQRLADTMPNLERLALQRRVHQLTMDYLYNVIVLTRNEHFLSRKLKVLSNCGLYPLPDHDYTQKYVWFRRLANNPLGLSLLTKTLPIVKKER